MLVLVSLIATRGVISTGRLGSVPWFCSVVLDHYGVLYKEHALSTGRIAGVVLLAAGVALVRFF